MLSAAVLCLSASALLDEDRIFFMAVPGTACTALACSGKHLASWCQRILSNVHCSAVHAGGLKPQHHAGYRNNAANR
jgi:hypothetical protein